MAKLLKIILTINTAELLDIRYDSIPTSPSHSLQLPKPSIHQDHYRL